MKKMQLKNKLKKFIFVLPIFIFVFSLACLPVSAIISGDSELTILDSSTAYIPGNSSTEVFANTLNSDSYSSASFQMQSQGMYEINLKFNFSSSHTYGTIRLLITSNNSEATSNLVSNPTYQGVFVNGSKKTEADGWHYGHVNAYTVEIIYKGYMPSNFNVVSYYNCPNPISAYLVSTYVFTPIDKATQDIIDNQDNNASEIMQNQNENTDEILNGWDTDASPDENTTDDYSDIEQSLIDDTQDNADNANVEVTDNFVGSLQRYVSGFGAVSQMFSDLLLVQVPDVNGIVWFSLAMGVVPLIVGSTFMGLRSRDRASARVRSQNDYKRGYNAGYTKGKGG